MIFSATTTVSANISNIDIDGKNNVFYYTENNIEINTFGENLIIKHNSDNYNNWTIEPDLPRGLKFFANDWMITNSSIDSFNKESCTISSSTDILCWSLGEQDVIIELLNSDILDIDSSSGVFKSVAVGGSHKCSLYENITEVIILCWGSNWDGQIGLNWANDEDHSIIGRIDGNNWATVVTGSTHSCSLDDSNNIYCWGNGKLGQLGNGEFSNEYQPKRVEYKLLDNISTISSGGDHNCLIDDGEIYCWGWNGKGQLGDGTYENRNVPVKVLLPEDFDAIEISLGNSHSCALLVNKDVYCWGDNSNQQILNSSENNYKNPEKINMRYGISVNEVLAGSGHTCILAHEVYLCQGKIKVDTSRDISKIRVSSSGDGYNCFVEINGELFCDWFYTPSHIKIPNELEYATIPSMIKQGTISGMALDQHSASYSIKAEKDGLILQHEIYLIIDFSKDIDADGWNNLNETLCGKDDNNSYSYPLDFDDDGICDYLDNDDDGDGIDDNKDKFPYNAEESEDDDNDGIGKNSDSFELITPLIGFSITFFILISLLLLEINLASKQKINQEKN